MDIVTKVVLNEFYPWKNFKKNILICGDRLVVISEKIYVFDYTTMREIVSFDFQNLTAIQHLVYDDINNNAFLLVLVILPNFVFNYDLYTLNLTSNTLSKTARINFIAGNAFFYDNMLIFSSANFIRPNVIWTKGWNVN